MILTTLLASLLVSCSSSEEKTVDPTETTTNEPTIVYENFEKGKVLNPVIIKGDTNLSYTLYLPSTYSTKQKYPVIYFFDPHSGGHIPIDRYKALGEKYGFILIGSNDTENGMKMEGTIAIIQKLMFDAQNRIAIDPNRIYACGFSGGSRVALNYAIGVGGINGVIACGAGPGTKQPPKQRFSFLGIAGNEDFNYTELMSIDRTFINSGWSHYFMEFNGKHEWPPVETMDDAFVWLQFDAMRNAALSKDDSVVRKFIHKNEILALELEKSKKIYEAYRVYEKLAMFTYGLNSDSTYLVAGRKLEEGAELKAVLQRKTEMETKEDTVKKMYTKSLQSKDAVWWDAQIKKLNSEAKTMKEKDEVLLRKRLLSYLSLAAYMSASGAVKFADFKGADHFLKIYEGVDPTNPEHAFIRAVVHAKQNEPDKAIESLRKSVKLGFSDTKRIVSEPVLLQLKSKYKEFDELVENVKANAKKQK